MEGDGMAPRRFLPGGDAKAIAEIAERQFGGYLEMFEYHGWPERGQDMMRKVQTRVVETYGSVHAFNEKFRRAPEQPAMSAGNADAVEPPDDQIQTSWTMRFTDLHLTDFRGAKDLMLSFEPDVTVIVGRNGAGKTSILDALAIIFNLSRTQPGKRGTTEVGLRPSAQDVREGQDCATLQATCEVRKLQLETPQSSTLSLSIFSDGRRPRFNPPQDTVEPPEQVLSPPRLVYYRQDRGFEPGDDSAHSTTTGDILDPDTVQDRSLGVNLRAIRDLGAWWDQLDAQEARRVRDGERDYRDPQLEAIRSLIERIDSFSGVVFNSTTLPPGLHFIKNDGTPVHVSGLSGGERSYIILLADLARRLQAFAPGKPLEQISAIVLIDEIELNLHPGWQSDILSTLTDVFRACQFIVTTHSPQVLSGVESRKVRIIEEDVPGWSWRVTVPLSTRGRTSNYLLEGVLGARERFPPIDQLIDTFNTAIDKQDAATAVDTLDSLEREIAGDAPTLLLLRKRLKKLRRAE